MNNLVTKTLSFVCLIMATTAWASGNPEHGAYFHAKSGLTIAYITGPETWTMRYDAPTLPNNALLGTNPFINLE